MARIGPRDLHRDVRPSLHARESRRLPASITARRTGTASSTDPRFAVRIAEQDGAAAGFAKLGPPSLPFEVEGPTAELRQLYVLKPWQGAGVAPALMAWVLDEARRRGAEQLFLSVFVDNHRAQRFYARYGFEAVGTYAFMVGTHADEDIIMRLEL